MQIIAAQINPLVGDIEGNTQLMINEIQRLQPVEPDLVIFTELCMTGYPPEDLLMRPHLYKRCEAALEQLKSATQHYNTAIILGLPTQRDGHTYNTALCIDSGQILGRRDKEFLPNYTVFDEKRYFTPGHEPCVFHFKGLNIGLIICEDTWFKKPICDAKKAGAQLIISINASPFDRLKSEARAHMLQERIHDASLPIIYVNCVGGQDEIVFDGGSIALNADAALAARAPYFKTASLTLHVDAQTAYITPQQLAPEPCFEEKIYEALVLGVGDYIRKNKFPGAIIGLSGGIDSALTLAITADAIGADNITGVLMPSPYTADISIDDAIAEAQALGTPYQIIPITPVLNAFLSSLDPALANQSVDITAQNIQARIRGTLLMALSNQFGSIVLTTSNKSELSVGYATLYGDMAGGFSVLKDIPKTLVYQLARYRNQKGVVIPERVLTRAPSAELTHNQTDQDSLPDYDTLDGIINLYIEQDQDPEAIIEQGYDRHTVLQVVKLVNRSEYKRRQAAPGIRTCNRAFGKDRRYPITSGYFIEDR